MDEIKERIKEISANLMLLKIAIHNTDEVCDPELIDRGLYSIIRSLDALAEDREI